MGVVGGLIPSPLHLIALTQATARRWLPASVLLVGPPMLVDGLFLVITFFFYQYIPLSIAHYTAYAGGVALAAFGGISLLSTPGRNPDGKGHSWSMSVSSVSLATLFEVTAPATWVFWLIIAGPVIAEGRTAGYWHIVPFFAGGLVGYYGAAFASVWLMAWGTCLHKDFNRYLFRVANVMLVVLGVWYFVHSYFAR